MLNLLDPKHAYMVGFIQADGHLYKNKTNNKGKLSIELKESDAELLYKFQEAIPCYSSIRFRIRTTNFSKTPKTSVILEACNLEFRQHLFNSGVPYGKKSLIIRQPQNISEIDYYRGLIDADGSVGVSNKGIKFISLTISSESLYKDYKTFLLKRLNFEVNVNRNKRDNIRNVMVTRENAVELAKLLYYKDCLALKRKLMTIHSVM